MICPTCQREMRIVSLIDERDVIEKMLKCPGLWQQVVRVDPQLQSGTDPPGGEWVYEPIDQDPFLDYDTEPVLFYANVRNVTVVVRLSKCDLFIDNNHPPKSGSRRDRRERPGQFTARSLLIGMVLGTPLLGSGR